MTGAFADLSVIVSLPREVNLNLLPIPRWVSRAEVLDLN